MAARRSFGVDLDAGAALAGLDAITAAAGAQVRPAAQSGADVLYREVLLRVPESKRGHWFHGTHQKYFFPAGTLRDSIYQVYSKDNSTEGKVATYHVSWNHQKAPYGFMVEHGTSRAPAHPFMRPSYDAVNDEALQESKATFVKNMAAALPGVLR
jgi:HK97 gp10 family phage protein